MLPELLCHSNVQKSDSPFRICLTGAAGRTCFRHFRGLGGARDGGADNGHLKDKAGKNLATRSCLCFGGFGRTSVGQAGYECFDATFGDEAFGPLQTQYPVGDMRPHDNWTKPTRKQHMERRKS